MKQAFYFPHDSNARNDEKILSIIAKWGLWGYGLYWVFIEQMHDQEDGKLTLALLEGQAANFNIDPIKLREFFDDCVITKLFVIDNEKYWSKRVAKNKQKMLSIHDERSEAGKRGMASRWGSNNSVITKNNGVITEDNNKKKLKENKPKENKPKFILPPSPHSSEREGAKKITDLVFLTDGEVEKLKNEYGEDGFNRIVVLLDAYKTNNRKRTFGKDGYIDDYKVIHAWVKGKYLEELRTSGKKGNGRGNFMNRLQGMAEEELRK